MKRKPLLAIATAALFAWSGAHAMHPAEAVEPTLATPATVSEVPMSLTTLNSPDWKSGGFQGWGPMANLMTPGVSESKPTEFFDDMLEHAHHMADVNQARSDVWAANASMRAGVEPAPAYPSTVAGRFLQFFWR